MLLVGDPARRFALLRGLEAAATSAEAARWLITPAQRARWEKVKASVDSGSGAVKASPAGDWAGGTDKGRGGVASASAAAGEGDGESSTKRPRTDAGAAEHGAAGDGCGGSELSDTVGAVCVCLYTDGSADCAAAVSSGGTLFKFAGRVGDAAVPGCGCFARAARGPGGAASELACTSVTGVGEHAIRAEMGGRCGRAMLAASGAAAAESALAEAATEFVGPRDVGVLALWARRRGAAAGAAVHTQEEQHSLEVEFAAPWAARSFAVGYITSGGATRGAAAGGVAGAAGAAEEARGETSSSPVVQILRNEAGLGGSSVATFCLRCTL